MPLVLSRKQTEEIVIGPDIIIRVVEIRGNRVRLGISAPRETTITRRDRNQDSVEPPAG